MFLPRIYLSGCFQRLPNAVDRADQTSGVRRLWRHLHLSEAEKPIWKSWVEVLSSRYLGGSQMLMHYDENLLAFGVLLFYSPCSLPLQCCCGSVMFFLHLCPDQICLLRTKMHLIARAAPICFFPISRNLAGVGWSKCV